MKPISLAAIVLLCSCALFATPGCAHLDAQQQASAGSTAAPSDSTSTQGAHTTLVDNFRNTDLGNGWQPTGSMELQYARCFTVDYYEGGYALVCVADKNRYLVIPPNAEVPQGIASDIVLLKQPISDVYLAASDSLCLFEALDAQDCISVSGIERDDWYSDSMKQAMDQGRVAYGGKYRAPDYELLLSRGVRLALESTMINHTPAVRDKLFELGIPVLVELSSYESEPLGRAEWIRLYGMLCNKDDLAQQVCAEQVAQVEALDNEPTGKTVAFFYFNGSGAPVVRKPGDYVTRMIEIAGGTYAFSDLEQASAGSSTLTLQMEQFYATAKNADVLIYNSSIDNTVSSLDELKEKNELLGNFKAVQNGDVWVTGHNMYQQMIQTGSIISDFGHVLRGTTEGVTHLRRLT